MNAFTRRRWRAPPARRMVMLVLAVGLGGALGAHAERPPRATQGYDNVEYNGRFTFSRIRYGGGGFGRGRGAAWAHDYPDADLNLPAVLSEISSIHPNLGRSNVFDLEDDAIFQHPILYISEPGDWTISEHGVRNLREFLLKGGFLIADDFEADQWNNFAYCFKLAMPEYEFIKLDVKHPIFRSFFAIDKLDTPHPLVRVEPNYIGVFENNDPAGRMIAIINHNNDLAEYWERSGTGFFAMDPTNGAFKLGINYVVYALTH
jgi:hypothetical protein